MVSGRTQSIIQQCYEFIQQCYEWFLAIYDCVFTTGKNQERFAFTIFGGGKLEIRQKLENKEIKCSVMALEAYPTKITKRNPFTPTRCIPGARYSITSRTVYVPGTTYSITSRTVWEQTIIVGFRMWASIIRYGQRWQQHGECCSLYLYCLHYINSIYLACGHVNYCEPPKLTLVFTACSAGSV